MANREGEGSLRAKYRDHCSALVADALLSLSAEEIYALAEERAREEDQLGPASYTDAIRLATSTIRERLSLPEYDAWAAEYLENPKKFDPYLMGLWKSEE